MTDTQYISRTNTNTKLKCQSLNDYKTSIKSPAEGDATAFVISFLHVNWSRSGNLSRLGISYSKTNFWHLCRKLTADSARSRSFCESILQRFLSLEFNLWFFQRVKWKQNVDKQLFWIYPRWHTIRVRIISVKNEPGSEFHFDEICVRVWVI